MGKTRMSSASTSVFYPLPDPPFTISLTDGTRVDYDDNDTHKVTDIDGDIQSTSILSFAFLHYVNHAKFPTLTWPKRTIVYILDQNMHRVFIRPAILFGTFSDVRN